MNLLPKISIGSAGAGSVELRYLVYFYLISAATVVDGLVVSAAHDDLLVDAFHAYPEADIRAALKELRREQLIQEHPDDDEYIVVGYRTGKKSSLFAPDDGSSDVYRTRLLELATQAVDTAVRKSRARHVKSLLDGLFARPQHSWDLGEYIQLYELAYEITYGEEFRDMTGKERGQFKYLLTQYDGATLQKMIILYVTDAERFVKKSAPTVALLVYNKDTVKLASDNRSKAQTARKNMRSSMNKSEDF